MSDHSILFVGLDTHKEFVQIAYIHTSDTDPECSNHAKIVVLELMSRLSY
jgi:hypothetical protein